MKLNRVRFTVLVLAVCSGQMAAQTTDRSRQSAAKVPSLQQNQQLIDSLNQTIAENEKALQEHEKDLLADLGLRYGAFADTTKKVKDAFEVLGSAYDGYQTGGAYEGRQYAEALYQVIVTFVGLIKGPIGLSAEVPDLLRNLAESWAIGRYQANLVEQVWNLQQSIQLAQFKDPTNQAEFKRVLDRLNSDLPTERAAFKDALAKAGLTEQSLFENTKDSDPFTTTAIKRGLLIIDPASTEPSSQRAGPSRQDYVDASNKALAAFQRCSNALMACQVKCFSVHDTLGCQRACGNCDAELAEHNKAIKRLEDFDLKQAQSGSQPAH